MAVTNTGLPRAPLVLKMLILSPPRCCPRRCGFHEAENFGKPGFIFMTYSCLFCFYHQKTAKRSGIMANNFNHNNWEVKPKDH